MPLKIFVDSDVVISSLLSSTGAASFLIHQTENIKLFVSNLSQKEMEIVTDRLHIQTDKLQSLLERKFTIIDLRNKARENYFHYVLDKNDVHIVFGAKETQVRFLITYNIKDFNSEKIKQDLNILIMTPGQFLQYLRSLQ